MAEHCGDHSGCMARIKSLERSDVEQWKRINSFGNRANLILGSVLVSAVGTICILLLTIAKGKP